MASIKEMKEKFTNGNMTFWQKIGEKIIGGIILAIIISGFTVWRNQAVIETKIESISLNILRIEKTVGDFVKRFDEHLVKK